MKEVTPNIKIQRTEADSLPYRSERLSAADLERWNDLAGAAKLALESESLTYD